MNASATDPWPQAGGTLLGQTAYFAPQGLPGLLYWYSLYPVHGAIFSGMIAALAAAASRPGATGASRHRVRETGRHPGEMPRASSSMRS